MITMLALLVRARWSALLVTGLLAAVLGGLAAAGTVYPRHAGDRIAADEVAHAPKSDREFLLLPDDAADAGSLKGKMDGVRQVDGLTAIPSIQMKVMGVYRYDPIDLLYREGSCTHVRLTSGRCPVGTGELLMPADDAKKQSISVGAQLVLAEAMFDQLHGWYPSPAGSQPFTVVGIYKPVDQDEIYWGQANPFRTELTGTLTAPMLTEADSFATIPNQDALQSADVLADPQLLAASSWDELKDSLTGHLVDPPQEGIPDLMGRIAARRTYVEVMTPAVVVPVIALGCLVLFLLVSRRIQRERLELGVQNVRGLPLHLRWWIAAAAPAAAALAGVVIGGVLGGALYAPLTGFALLACLVAIVLAVLPVVTARPVDALREVGPSWATRVRGLPLGELGLGALAIAAAVLARTGDRQGLGIYAPALLAGAVALAIVRLLPALLRVIAARLLKGGRLVVGLAAAQLARRPSARPLIALTSLAVALLALVAGAWDAASQVRTTQAAFTVGADKVLTVRAYTPQQVLNAVRTIDPQGRYAVAAGRITGGERQPTVLVIDLSRANLLSWTPAAGYAAELAAPPADPPKLSGATVDVTLTVGGGDPARPNATPNLGLILDTADGQRVSAEIGNLHPGTQTVTAKLPPACANGCELAAVVGHGLPNVASTVAITSIGAITGVDSWTVYGDKDPGWTVGGDTGYSDTYLMPPSAPAAIPVVATPNLSLSARAYRISGPGGRPPGVPVDEKADVTVLPRIGEPGVLADFTAVTRATAGGRAIDTMEVWLTADAPADVTAKLSALGVQVAGEETRQQALDRAGQTPQAWTLQLHLAATVVAWLLVAAVLLAVARLDRGSSDINALRFAGVRAAVLRRAARLAYAASVLLGVVLGLIAAAVAWLFVRDALPISDGTSWAPPPSLPHLISVAVPVAGAALLLMIVAWLAFAQRSPGRR
ncbi:hypothetical protein [Hamadaea tsunoensis]|uniref:hypothetical protein n=1 Tax=Hamadaea tsunoensis TaxID=53368 RepID=UPI0004061A1D|nr:hypothetical protein [Hamadaea tsunoensis]